jgi:hypothetical protein
MPPIISKNSQNQSKETKNTIDLLQNVINGATNSPRLFRQRFQLRVNKAYAQTCGYKPEEMIGKNHFTLYPHAENEAIFRQGDVDRSFLLKPYSLQLGD